MTRSVPPSDLRLDASLFHGYTGAPGSYDEVFAESGALRPAWRRFVEAAEGLSRPEFGRRWEHAQRLLRQNSLAYPDPNDPGAKRVPWALDAFPLVIDAEEWTAIAASLRQRALLLDEVLRDLFGPQKLLKSGLLPAEVVYRHPGFLLPYARGAGGSAAAAPVGPADRMLHFYAADLARSPDGQWWVLADRCESPSGAGFSLQNRIALSQILPDVFHECRVERLAPYFISLQEHLAEIAPARRRQPRVVVMSEEAGSANYFEDAFLARYLGYALAEAGDLAVRQNELFLKTLGGLSPVDVLLRRPNSENCDPLELSDVSSLGVAGLMQSVRSGALTVANSLGSGLVESPVFLAFLPRLAQAVLGDQTAMPNVATWWCGDAESFAYVRSRIDELAIKPAYRRRGQGTAHQARLAAMKRSELLACVEADPGAYVAQERVARSAAPVWATPTPQSAYISWRAFGVAHQRDYAFMPGGLARVSSTLASLEQSLLAGERSKDVWVLADGPVSSITLLAAADEPLELRRGGVDLPSRAAEHFFWLGRHAVRAESLGKLIRAAALRLSSEEDADRIPELPVLLRVLAEQGQIEPGYVVDEIRLQLPAIEKLLPAAVFDDAQVGTLRSTVTGLAGLAATVRDLLSLDSWRIIRQMDDEFRPGAQDDGFLDMLVKIDGLLMQLAALTGQVTEGMTRTHAWRFLDFGRRLERAVQMGQLVGTMIADDGAADSAALESLLEVSDSLMTYRSRYYSRVQLAAVLDLLVADETNPRSIAHQLVQCAEHVLHLPGAGDQSGGAPEQHLASSLLQLVRAADVRQLARAHETGDADPLDELLQAIAAALPRLSDALSNRYFFHAGAVQRLGAIDLG